MESEMKKRLEEGLADPNWAGWFKSISKENLWMELVSENERIVNFFEEKIEVLRIEHKRDLREAAAATKAYCFWWFIIGGVVGSATGFFI